MGRILTAARNLAALTGVIDSLFLFDREQLLTSRRVKTSMGYQRPQTDC
jgi:hypothetical protein